MKFASFEANFGWDRSLLVYPILLFSLPLSGRSTDKTDILTGTLSLNLINNKNDLFNIVLMFYIPVNNFSVVLGHFPVFLG